MTDLTTLIYQAECKWEQHVTRPTNQVIIVEYNDIAKEVNKCIGFKGLKIINN
jgi:hypothetical protein